MRSLLFSLFLQLLLFQDLSGYINLMTQLEEYFSQIAIILLNCIGRFIKILFDSPSGCNRVYKFRTFQNFVWLGQEEYCVDQFIYDADSDIGRQRLMPRLHDLFGLLPAAMLAWFIIMTEMIDDVSGADG